MRPQTSEAGLRGRSQANSNNQSQLFLAGKQASQVVQGGPLNKLLNLSNGGELSQAAGVMNQKSKINLIKSKQSYHLHN